MSEMKVVACAPFCILDHPIVKDIVLEANLSTEER
jgi:hypothetical protein